MKNIIFDIGMNDGKDTAFYLHLGYKVISVDANKKLCDEAAVKFEKEISEGRLIILNLAISESSGKQTFYINKKESQWSSLMPEIGGRYGMEVEEVEVTCTTMFDLINNFGIPKYAKIDIEGADVFCLDSLMNCPKEFIPEYISVEADNTGLIDKMVQIGYTKFKLVSQGYMNERKFKDWQFQEGSSGTFGEDTEGPWLTKEEVIEQFHQSHPPYVWYDFHAKLS